MSDVKELMELAVEEPVVETPAPKKTLKWKTKECPVVNYIARFGILGFSFGGVPCQILVDKNMTFGNTVTIKYKGEIGKNIEFSL